MLLTKAVGLLGCGALGVVPGPQVDRGWWVQLRTYTEHQRHLVAGHGAPPHPVP